MIVSNLSDMVQPRAFNRERFDSGQQGQTALADGFTHGSLLTRCPATSRAGVS